jgi:acyl-CoA thioesterase-1
MRVMAFRRGFGLACLLGALLLAQFSSAAATPSATILVMGDSLSAGYGMNIEQSWPSLLEQKLTKEGYGYRVVNASQSGETTAGGRARFARALERHSPQIVILELGSNDGLRGLPLTQIRANLDWMIRQAQAADAHVLLIGMRMPPNYGDAYTSGFQKLFADLAHEHDTGHIDFFLERVALEPALMQADQLHPTASAQPILLETVWPKLEPLLKTTTARHN